MERRLAAILTADVVGYSRLMETDEAGTLVALKAHRRELIDPEIASYRGRIVKLMGDGALVEFASVVDAVTCALAIQRGMADRNQSVPENRRIDLRIGVHLGDIIVDGDDIYGDGVNVAARLEGLAESGGICLSQQAYDQIETKLRLPVEDLGQQQVKNIARPVRAYRILRAGAAPLVPLTPKKPRVGTPWLLGLAGVMVLTVLGLVIGLWQPWAPDVEPASVEAMAFPLPDKPSIAVLPFSNMSDDPSQEYFADGMTEDLITDLAKISGLFVISRNSTFAYKGRAVNVRQIAEDLGVRYILEGSVRRVGNVVRINVQLIDATTGGHLWAERYDGKLADILNLQDQVGMRIVDALALELTPQEAQLFGDLGTENVEAHDAYLLGLSFYYHRTPEGFAEAKTHFERAIELDAGYSAAYAALAKVYAQADSINYSRALRINDYDALAKARMSLAKAQSQPIADVHVVRSWLACHRHQHRQAVAEAERALELSPNDVDALEALSQARIYAGQPNLGITLAERAMRQNPTLLTRPFLLMGLAEFALGDFNKAAEHIERARQLGSEETKYAGILAAAHGLLGHMEKAKAAFDVFRKSHTEPPDLARSMVLFPFSDAKVLERLAEGLERAGAKVWFSREDGGYLPLNALNRLDGADIAPLFFGTKIVGKDFSSSATWQRTGTVDGAVKYNGFQIQPGIPRKTAGFSRIEDEMLCERWEAMPEPVEFCSVIFRVPEGNARIRWGNYVIVTDTAPYPFNLAK